MISLGKRQLDVMECSGCTVTADALYCTEVDGCEMCGKGRHWLTGEAGSLFAKW
ncbi:hypothetical protein B9Z19DRAFT_1091392 [Tuber borchii]|uniref:Uncharacterized protein n=1 Tax=Tuber borchii TaxID=42251 RepID=A0A2T6ZHM3_TUBBO|nr:hypothetical protein B9Z19DRAFT_1091392 [Tuber borchii]